MPNTSIVFSPELDERELDREVSAVDERLGESATDIPTSFSGDGVEDLRDDLQGATEDLTAEFEGQMDSLSPAGGGLDAVGGGGGIGGATTTGTAAGLASKIPKPIAGVLSGAALPVALAGGVGVGLLSAMQGASARLQTSTTLLGQAWDNVWRPIGDRVDSLFIRPIAKDLLSTTRNFEEQLRRSFNSRTVRGGWAGRVRATADLAGLAPVIGAEFESALNAAADIIDPTVNVTGNVSLPDINVPSVDWHGLISEPDWVEVLVGPRWADIIDTVDWDDLLGDFEWPSLPDFEWPSLPSFRWPSFDWPTLPDFSWPDLPTLDWPNITAGSIVGSIDWPTIDPGQIVDELSGGGGSDDGGVFDGPWLPQGPWLQGGGRVTETGVATVHRGELVADPDRLVSELASAIDSAGGGGGTAQVDTSGVEDRLDRLHRDMRRLESALDVTLEVGKEEVGRAAAEGKRELMSDSDPTV